MEKILIDINVILDFLNKRNFYDLARQVMQLCSDKKVQGYVCAHEITTLSYFLEKNRDSKMVNKILVSIMNMFTIIPVDENILRKSLTSKIKDFEDAVIEVSSLQNDVDYIISRDKDDFIDSSIPCLSPKDFLDIFTQSTPSAQ
jgi:predicted nucleic acid-binding protein